MNENIHIMREAVKVITQMLTESSVRVTQEGLSAFVENDPRTNKPIRVNLPYLPDNASDQLIAAVQGFLDHEVAHVLFTDFNVKSGNKELHNLTNLLEDSRVEKLMAKKYRGSYSNLENTGNFFLDNVISPEFERLQAEGAPDEQLVSSLFTPMMRALSGQELYADYLKDKMPIIQDLWDKLTPLKPELEKLASTKDAARIANRVYKILNEVDDDAPEDHDDNAEDESGEGEGEGGGEGGGEGKGKGIAPSASSGEDEGEGEGEEGEAAAGGGESEDEGEGEGAEGKESDDKGSKGGKPKDSQWKPGDNKDSERKMGKYGSAILDSMKDELNGFSESVSTKIAEDAASFAKESEYNVFTNEGDVIEKLSVPERNYNDSMFSSLENKTREMVAPMQKDLERAIQARSQAVWESGLRKGKLNSGSLARLASTGDSRVFRKKQESSTKDVAVSLVIDASGSMSGSKIHTAAAAAYALSSVLDRLKIAHEVICFTTHTPSASWGDRREAMQKARRDHGVEYSRSENLYMPIIKGFDERINTETKRRFGWLPNSGMLANNVDGECVEIAARRLQGRKETGKIMMVLSDGHPAASGSSSQLNAHLKSVVSGIEKKRVNIIGIGIESNAVERFYPKHMVLNDVAELPSLVISRLKQMLLG